MEKSYKVYDPYTNEHKYQVKVEYVPEGHMSSSHQASSFRYQPPQLEPYYMKLYEPDNNFMKAETKPQMVLNQTNLDSNQIYVDQHGNQYLCRDVNERDMGVLEEQAYQQVLNEHQKRIEKQANHHHPQGMQTVPGMQTLPGMQPLPGMQSVVSPRQGMTPMASY